MKTTFHDWIKDKIDEAGEGKENFLGPLKDELLKQAKNAPPLTRYDFKRWYDDFSDYAKNHDPQGHWVYLDITLQFADDFDKVWDIQASPQFPEINIKSKFDRLALSSEFVKVGGCPEWLQDERKPICPSCDKDMAFLMQVGSQPYEVIEKKPELNAYSFMDMGYVSVFFCSDCFESATTLQTH